MENKNIWNNILNLCRHTVGKSEISKEPSKEWKKRILLCEHSPIRIMTFSYTFENIKSLHTFTIPNNYISLSTQLAHAQKSTLPYLFSFHQHNVWAESICVNFLCKSAGEDIRGDKSICIVEK